MSSDWWSRVKNSSNEGELDCLEVSEIGSKVSGAGELIQWSHSFWNFQST